MFMPNAIPYKSYCWSLGTTSFRTKNFNKTIEEQLALLDGFWQLPENQDGVWNGNNELQSRYNDSQSILKILFDQVAFTQLIELGGASFKKPWFGQLMTGPQLLAYFIQLDEWFKQYRIQLVL